MSQAEKRLADSRGKYAQVIRNSRPIDDAEWEAGRFLLSNKRLLIVSGDGKRSLPLSEIVDIGDRYDVNQSIARVTDYISLRRDDDVILLAPDDVDEFEHDLFTAVLEGEVVLARSPAVKGGVVQDTDWEKARLKLGDDSVHLVTESGSVVPIELDDIGKTETENRTVAGTSRDVVEVEHSEEGTSVQTYLSGSDQHCSFLESLLGKGVERAEAGFELDDADKQVLMALYSGISPFEIPEFTGLDVEEVEEIFEWFIERDVLEEVRKRREVEFTTRGRNIAGDVIDEE